ncbi:MAG: hypothetical protein WEE64_10180 [Dehalococcoidia bacterium]
MRVSIARLLNRDVPVAEIWCGEVSTAEGYMGEVFEEDGALVVEFYPQATGHPWRVDLEDLLAALGSARAGLQSKAGDAHEPKDL